MQRGLYDGVQRGLGGVGRGLGNGAQKGVGDGVQRGLDGVWRGLHDGILRGLGVGFQRVDGGVQRVKECQKLGRHCQAQPKLSQGEAAAEASLVSLAVAVATLDAAWLLVAELLAGMAAAGMTASLWCTALVVGQQSEGRQQL